MHGFEQSISLDLPPMSAIYIKKNKVVLYRFGARQRLRPLKGG